MKPVPLDDFPHYMITESGELYSFVSLGVNQKVLSVGRKVNGFFCEDGYKRYLLRRGGKSKKFYGHHLVAITYVGPRPSMLHQVRHLDGNRKNNHASNLRWGTVKENAADKVAHGNSSRGEKNVKAKLTASDVVAIRKMVSETMSQTDIAKKFGVTHGAVNHIVNGHTWSWLKDDEERIAA